MPNDKQNLKYDLGEKIPFVNLEGRVKDVLVQNSLDPSVENLEKIVADKSFFVKARVFDAMGFSTEAEKYYLNSFETDLPEVQAKALLNLGIIYFAKGSIEKAMEYLQAATITIFPEVQAKAYIGLGDLYFQQERVQEARDVYKKAKGLGSQKIKDIAKRKLMGTY